VHRNVVSKKKPFDLQDLGAGLVVLRNNTEFDVLTFKQGIDKGVCSFSILAGDRAMYTAADAAPTL
jgi:hypothetical protein